MRHWVGIVSAEQFANERLYAHDVIGVPVGSGAAAVPGDRVALLTTDGGDAAPVLFGDGIVRGAPRVGTVLVEYRQRRFDDPPPVPADLVPASGSVGLHPLPQRRYSRLAALAGAAPQSGVGRSVWFVSVALPIEAASRAEAVREFWTYLDKLGPRQLPAYVWPLGDELAMQAFVLGAVTNLDPEQDDGD
ncbi:MAG TPA: hypothetical protein VH561_07790 [Micromonosporaceae bacterium]|jgi:hypothetical protein